ncbi:MAG TPA: Spx/MgsR family RNA polymerase-binding regulatory protein [Candidatus Binatus sp.]|jgi:arsenate reductase (glutaredoxin)|nr:Spx/MgsR family RNA polymerase-binding regulatory protein [Candidatus Binatus sp.]
MAPRKRAKKTQKRAKKTRGRVKFLHKPSCSTCRKARRYLEKRGLGMEFRDLGKERLSPEELEQLIGDRDHTQFLNPRNELYRRKNMKENPPSRREAIRRMAADPNLIRRPVILAGGRIVLGFDKEGIARL